MKWITPFAYIDAQNTLHCSAPLVLQEVGLEESVENLHIAVQVIAELLEEALPTTQILVMMQEGRPESAMTVADFRRLS